MNNPKPESADNNDNGKERYEKMENPVHSQWCSYRDRHQCAISIAGSHDRLGKISRDKEPFENLFKLSLYVLGDRQCLGRREMKTLVLGVMAKIGCTLKPNDCHVDVAGRKVAASVVLPPWAWPA